MSIPVPSSDVMRLFGAAVAALIAVWLVRVDALRREVLDVPNERSSHSRPTPRGGGLGVVAVILGGSALLWRAGILTPTAALAACLAGVALVAAVGWVDDHGGLPVRTRLAVHVLAGLAAAFLSVRSGFAPMYAVWWLFWSVSAVNVINFMDGIDGLIATQCAIAFGVMGVHAGPGAARALALVASGACLGFLYWNRSPAKIFLGDVGSGALGYLIAVVGLLAMRDGGADVVRVFLALYPLFLDASWTFLRRLRNGERITQAHRSHLYQRLANGGWGHGRVTLLYAAAAAVGAAITFVDDERLRAALIAVYAVAVVVVGAVVDRTRPFEWRVAGPRQHGTI